MIASEMSLRALFIAENSRPSALISSPRRFMSETASSVQPAFLKTRIICCTESASTSDAADSSFAPEEILSSALLIAFSSIETEFLRSSTPLIIVFAPEDILSTASVAAALAGKVLPITAVMFLISLVMLVIDFKIVGTPLNGSLAVILAGTLLFILSYQSISVLIVSLLANLRLSLSIGGGYSVLAFTFSGLTFPIMAMWEPMQWVSKIFPFTFYTDIFVDQMLRGAPWVYSLPDLCYMSLFIVLPLLCLPRLKRVCTEEKFWGRL